MSWLVADRATLARMRAADDAESGMPVRGRHVGGGRHVAMTDDPTSPGWTRHRLPIAVGDVSHALPIDDQFLERTEPTLSAADRDRVAARLARLPEDFAAIDAATTERK